MMIQNTGKCTIVDKYTHYLFIYYRNWLYAIRDIKKTKTIQLIIKRQWNLLNKNIIVIHCFNVLFTIITVNIVNIYNIQLRKTLCGLATNTKFIKRAYLKYLERLVCTHNSQENFF